ncbi:hypothetical protein QYM36_013219 [Artemia franciscana]|uniref:Uncharacterized protein n=1 Tax=Artemia franciscana TaxID=6661 RepID=A0AA88HPM3_ARTSF|nr:hypothetical protein QYM36_013219 [Artemia franciscana]
MESQRQFVSKCVTKKSVGRRTTNASSSRWQNSLCYTLGLNSTCKKVCKKFFLATLGEKFVAGCVKSKTNTGTAGRDRRNVSSPKNLVSKRLTDDQLLYARNHISSFPAVESHYCRANSTRLYLSSELHQSKMYKLYTETCLSSRRVPVCKSINRKIFKSLNLSFHTPRKDQCHTCTRHYLITEGEKQNEAESFQQHQSRAKRAREVKNAITDVIKVNESRRRMTPNKNSLELVSAYKGPIPLPPAKYKDLMDLCHTLVSPKTFHEYYAALPSSESTRDALGESDVEEEDPEDL